MPVGPRKSYWDRLKSKAHADFRSYWSLHQFWAVLATSGIGPAVWAYFAHQPNKLMDSLQSIAASGAIGLVGAVSGSYVFGFFRAVKKIDEDWEQKCSALESSKISALADIEHLRAHTEAPKVSVVEQDRRGNIKTVLEQFTLDEKLVLKKLLHGRTNSTVMGGWSIAQDVIDSSLRKARQAGIVIHTPPSSRSMDQTQWHEVNPDYVEALTFNLHGV